MMMPLATVTRLGRPKVNGYAFLNGANDFSTKTSVSRYIPPFSGEENAVRVNTNSYESTVCMRISLYGRAWLCVLVTRVYVCARSGEWMRFSYCQCCKNQIINIHRGTNLFHLVIYIKRTVRLVCLFINNLDYFLHFKNILSIWH